MQMLQPLVIVGASGAGKGTIVKHLLKKFPEYFKLSVSWTTRNMREGEQNGREYHFVTHEKFNQSIKNDEFIEVCHVHGNIYGSNKYAVQAILDEQKVCILEIDIQGAIKVKTFYPNANFLCMTVPSLQILEQRLRDRKTDSEEQIKLRLKNAVDEINQIKEANIFVEIINDDLENTYRQVENYIQQKYPQLDFNQN